MNIEENMYNLLSANNKKSVTAEIMRPYITFTEIPTYMGATNMDRSEILEHLNYIIDEFHDSIWLNYVQEY